jgi:hypothetical protein
MPRPLPAIYNMTKPNYIILIILLFSCVKSSNKLKQVEIIQVSKLIENPYELKIGKYIQISFHHSFFINDYDTSDYSRSLYIIIPFQDSSFVLKNDSTHLFSHVVTNCRGLCDDSVREPVDSGQIKGRLNSNLTWEIEATTKYFQFKKTISLIRNLDKEIIKY